MKTSQILRWGMMWAVTNIFKWQTPNGLVYRMLFSIKHFLVCRRHLCLICDLLPTFFAFNYYRIHLIFYSVLHLFYCFSKIGASKKGGNTVLKPSLRGSKNQRQPTSKDSAQCDLRAVEERFTRNFWVNGEMRDEILVYDLFLSKFWAKFWF